MKKEECMMAAGSGLIILEGPDACGKTTLARRLLGQDQDGYVHMHWPKEAKDPAREMLMMHRVSLAKAEIRLRQGKRTVIDRHWISNEIYGPIFRGGTMGLTISAEHWDQKIIPALRGVYVICAPQPELAVELHAIRGDESGKTYKTKLTSNIDRVAIQYRKLWTGGFSDGIDYASQIIRDGGMCNRPNAMLYDIFEHGKDLDLVCENVAALLQRQ